MSDYHKQRKALKRASHGSTKPFYGTYISVRDTKMAGPYGVLDGEDFKKTRDDKVQNGGRGGIRTLGGR